MPALKHRGKGPNRLEQDEALGRLGTERPEPAQTPGDGHVRTPLLEEDRVMSQFSLFPLLLVC